MLVNYCFVDWIFSEMYEIIERKNKYEKVMIAASQNENNH